MSNVMTPERLSALKRLRGAQGKVYDGCIADAYEMFLVVDECFRNSETEDVCCWLPATRDTLIEDGSTYLVAIDVCTKERPRAFVYDVWSAECDSENPVTFSTISGDSPCYDWADVSWYMPLPFFNLPVMKIQEPSHG